MRVLDVLTSPWAITPEMLQTICAVYDRHARGESTPKETLAAIEAATGASADGEGEGYTVQDGVAIVPLDGVITKRAGMFTRVCGFVSTQQLQLDIQAALDDPSVHSIVLAIDSPGGSVDGTQAAARFVRAAREQKPIVALADGQMCSGAYWIGSAANEVFITGDTTAVGSIGVVAAHVDRSVAEAQRGLKVTEITAGKYKRIASEHAPLTPEGFASMKEMVDHIYSVFVDDVAANRGADVATVLEQMADGRIFLGQKAIAAGLVDGVSSLPAVIAMLNDRVATAKYGAKAPTVKGENSMKEVLILGAACMTQEAVDAAVAAAIAKAQTDTQAATEAGLAPKLAEAKAAGMAEGATAERERILAVEANAMPGHEKLVAEMKADGKTTGPEAAQRILAAEKATRQQVASDLAADAPKPAPSAPAPDQGTAKGEAVDSNAIAAAAQDYVASEAKAGRVVSYSQAVAQVMKQQQAQ